MFNSAEKWDPPILTESRETNKGEVVPGKEKQPSELVVPFRSQTCRVVVAESKGRMTAVFLS